MNRLFKFIRWFYPGLKIKRWISVLAVGLILILIFAPRLSSDINFILKIVYSFLFGVGVISLVIGIASLVRSFFEVIYPHRERELIDIIYEKRFLSKGPKIVTIGGGTGLSTILEGLKEQTSNITAIVSVSDEGGSSGRLRKEFGILPPGDIRNCLVSLAEAPQLLRDLFQYRFAEGEGIKGHSFGNIFITALTEVTGSFQSAIKESSRVLAIRGKVVPASLEVIRIKAEYMDGSIMEGEDKIPKQGKSIKQVFIIPSNASPNPEALEAIRQADIIIIGPGSLFTSVLPNLLIKDISEEIAKRNVFKLYICNVMTQHGETDGFTASDHVSALISHTRDDIVNHCLVNSGRLDYNLLIRYSQEKSFPVILDKNRLKKLGLIVIEDDFVSKSNFLRHDPQKTAKAIMQSYSLWKKERTDNRL
ncbi:MAG: YvcK family protein [Candidatus Omnitrophica bacterium]|nr:YvcK family protein [Candidatus Omnitrophota bacterium]MCM8826351.1 YvcK family protein [Candidatus Omnitrophota bacterium]